jgi:GNAT superfamily N-acetyltransferase
LKSNGKSQEEKKADELRSLLWSPRSSMLAPAFENMLNNYPAHLHINLLPDYQRKGYGTKLMNVFLGFMSEEGVKGVHLGMVADNVNAEQFYYRSGFQRVTDVLDGGKSGENGRIDDTAYQSREI